YLSFFFSSRRRHTRFDCDWSSDVCSSDLSYLPRLQPSPLACPTGTSGNDVYTAERQGISIENGAVQQLPSLIPAAFGRGSLFLRSEERRVGKECRCWRGRVC